MDLAALIDGCLLCRRRRDARDGGDSMEADPSIAPQIPPGNGQGRTPVPAVPLFGIWEL
ncbi:hypothetical protein BCAR13_420027 [Paraburkholderia caribensis]|nr:hypothetical protein BCAR13_420027 [Paraburkholderia caribensis]